MVNRTFTGSPMTTLDDLFAPADLKAEIDAGIFSAVSASILRCGS